MPSKISFLFDRKWCTKIQSGLAAVESGHYLLGCLLLEEALNLAIQQRLSVDHLLHSYLLFGGALAESGQLEQSEITLHRAVEYSCKNRRQDTEVHMDLLTELGMLLFNRDNLVQATPVLERCVNLRRRKKFRTDPESLYVFLALIFCYLDLENWGKAKNFSRTTYKDCCKQRGEKDPVTLFVKQLHDVAVRKGASDSACGHHLRVVDKLSASS